MHSVTYDIHFSYGHRLFRHPGKCAHLHGHNGLAQIEVSSDGLDSRSMVVDFDQIKESIGRWIDENLDHKTILWEEDPLFALLKNAGETVVLIKEHPTAEVLARWIFQEARRRQLPVTKVTLWETPHSQASYWE